MILYGLCKFLSKVSQLLKFSLFSFLILCPLKTRVSGFVNRTIRFWAPDMSGLFHRFPIRFSRLVLKSSQTCPVFLQKNILDQIFFFWFISSIYLDLCDHVKILRCLNEKWIIDKEVLSWTISLWDLEQSHICQSLEEGVTPQNSKFWNVTKIHKILKLYINRLKLLSRI
jgi:hypothetical protein